MNVGAPTSRRLTTRGMAVLHLIALAAVLAAFAPPAIGQAMPGLPDPMTSRELSDYVMWLEMSPQQVHALEPMHDAYLERFRRLREGDMQRLQDDVLAMISKINFLNPQIPPREDLEEVVRRADRLLGRIKQVDSSLFDDMSSILTEGQLLLLPRIRLARQRELYAQVAWNMGREFNPGAGIDLSDMVRNLDLTPDEFPQIDPVLAQYEVQLSARVGDLHEAVIGVVPVILDLIDSLGIRHMTPEQMMEMGQDQDLIQRLKQTFDEASKPFQEATSSLSKLNLTTARRIEPLLNAEHLAEFRDRFYRRAFREIGNQNERPIERFRRALELEDLPADLAEAVRVARDSYLRNDAQVVDSLAGASEDRRAYRTADQLSEEDPHPLDDKIEDLRERRNVLAENAMANLESLLGPTRIAALDDEQQDPRGRLRDAEARIRELEDRAAREAQVEVAVGADGQVRTNVRRDEGSQRQLRAVVADPLNSEDVDRIAATYEVSEAQRPLLDAIYEDYRTGYEQFRDELGTMPETPAERMRLIEEAVQQAGARDEQFFSDLELTFGANDSNDKLKTLIAARRRQVLIRGSVGMYGGMFGGWEGGSESDIHLPDLVAELDLDDATNESVESMLTENARTIADQQRAVFESSLRLQRLQMVQDATAGRGGGFGPGSSAVDEAIMRRFREALGEVLAAREQQANENRSALEAIMGRLPAEQSWALKDAYNRQAFPNIYNDGDSAEPVIEKAMMLDDLTAPQREQLAEIAAAFRSRYHQLCEQMIDLRRRQESGAADFAFERGEMPREMIEREISIQRIRFDRREASERAKMRLRVVLNDEQRTVVFSRDEG